MIHNRQVFNGLLYVGKRKVLNDSEDDAEEQRYRTLAVVQLPCLLMDRSVKKSTPKKAASNKKV